MKKIAATIMAAGLIVGLAGCSSDVYQKPIADGIEVGTSYGAGSVTIVEVPDGDRNVKCAVLIGSRKGGISCDWSAR